VRRGFESRHKTGERRPDLGPVVEGGERQRKRIRSLPDRDPLVAELPQHPPATVGKGLAVELCNGLRRAEARRRPADEQHAGQLSTRHVSE
jgi:hypothetical protein